MIEVKKEKEFCEDCPLFDPEITKNCAYSDNEPCINITQITCKHRVFCNRMENWLRKNLGK